MDTHWLRSLVVLVIVALAVPVAVAAQSFEGVVRQRIIEVDEDQLMEMMYDEEREEPDFDSEEEWVAWTAAALFDIPVSRLLTDGSADVAEHTTWVKGDRFRVDVSGLSEEGYTIYDGSNATMFIVNPEERWYVRLSEEEMEAMAEDAERQAEEMAEAMGIDLEEMRRMAEEMEEEMEYEEMTGGEPLVRDLGQSREIAGMRASGHDVATADEAVRAWCAISNPGFASGLEKMAEQLGFDEEEMEEEGVALEDVACGDKFPLLVQTFSTYGGMMGGGSYTIDELLSVEETSVSDDLFEIPAGFEERSLSELWGSMR